MLLIVININDYLICRCQRFKDCQKRIISVVLRGLGRRNSQLLISPANLQRSPEGKIFGVNFGELALPIMLTFGQLLEVLTTFF